MNRRRALALALLVAALALTLVAWRWRRGHDARATTIAQPSGPSLAAASSRRLDVGAFRDQLARRRARAQALALRRRAAPDDAGVPTGPPRSHLAATMLEPACILGPVDLCRAIADTVDACDAGDGQACLAVGQYLEDNPPRPMVALSFYLYACRSGEQGGCDRMAAIKTLAASPAPCDDDPMACAWQALKAQDEARLDRACSLGVADACAFMLDRAEHDPPRARGYLEASCQLGNPMACEELGRRLAPACDEDCYPPDPEAAAEASTIACEVGFAAACLRLQGR